MASHTLYEHLNGNHSLQRRQELLGKALDLIFVEHRPDIALEYTAIWALKKAAATYTDLQTKFAEREPTPIIMKSHDELPPPIVLDETA